MGKKRSREMRNAIAAAATAGTATVAKPKPKKVAAPKPVPAVPVKPSRVVYLGHLPHGFVEKTMTKFFKQFGEVTRLHLSRNREGKSRHHAFVEFRHPEVADIVATTMDNYFMFDKYLVAHVVPAAKVHEGMFQGIQGKRSKPVPWKVISRKQHNFTVRDEAHQRDRLARMKAADQHRAERLKAAGIEYEFKGYAWSEEDDAAAAAKTTTTTTAKKETKAKAKAKGKAKTPADSDDDEDDAVAPPTRPSKKRRKSVTPAAAPTATPEAAPTKTPKTKKKKKKADTPSAAAAVDTPAAAPSAKKTTTGKKKTKTPKRTPTPESPAPTPTPAPVSKSTTKKKQTSKKAPKTKGTTPSPKRTRSGLKR